MLRCLTGFVFGTGFFCVMGAQHITYVRQANQAGLQLLRREQELRNVTQAYLSLQSFLATQASRGIRPVEARTSVTTLRTVKPLNQT